MWVHSCHTEHTGIKEKPAWISSLLFPCEYWDLTQFIRLDNKYFDLLRHHSNSCFSLYDLTDVRILHNDGLILLKCAVQLLWVYSKVEQPWPESSQRAVTLPHLATANLFSVPTDLPSLGISYAQTHRLWALLCLGHFLWCILKTHFCCKTHFILFFFFFSDARCSVV